MLLTQIAEAVETLLNSSPEKWTAEAGVTAEVTLDWEGCLSKTQLRVLIVPEMNQYDLETEAQRRTIIRTPVTKFISVMIGKGFVGLNTNGDIAPWEESKELVNIRERIAEFLIANPIPNLKLVEIEEIPIDELEIDHRNFIAVTQFGYQVIQCGSGPDLLSSSTALEDQSRRVLTRASGRLRR